MTKFKNAAGTIFTPKSETVEAMFRNDDRFTEVAEKKTTTKKTTKTTKTAKTATKPAEAKAEEAKAEDEAEDEAETAEE